MPPPHFPRGSAIPRPVGVGDAEALKVGGSVPIKAVCLSEGKQISVPYLVTISSGDETMLAPTRWIVHRHRRDVDVCAKSAT